MADMKPRSRDVTDGPERAPARAMLRAMVTFLLENGKIETTITRAKEVRPLAEKMITLGKTNTLHTKRQALSFITKESVVYKLFDEIAPKYAELVYYGFWYAPERLMLQKLVDESQKDVEGTVRLKLYKGNVVVSGRKSPKSLYSDNLVTFEDDRGAYDQKDAAGFIRLNALRLRTLAARDRQQN